MRMSTAIAATAACGASCGALLSFPATARIAALAPLTLFPLLYVYRGENRAASIWLSVLYTAATLLVGLQWVYEGAAAHQGVGDYYTSFVALLFVCAPYAIAGFAASYARNLPSLPWCVAIACLWTLADYWRATSAFGVPYVLMGHSLIDTPLAGISSAGGTEALTFAAVFAAAVFFEASLNAKLRVIAWPVAAILITANALTPARPPAAANGEAKVAIFQLGQVDDATMPSYISALRRTPPSADLAIWPESAFELSRNDVLTAIRETARAKHVALLMGGTATDADGVHVALKLIGSDGNVKGIYAKRQLVPFGEYLPLPNLAHLVFPASILSTVPNFSPGKMPTTFAVGRLTIGPLICYESAFPDLARDEVRRGANVLVAATNDAWFAQTPGLWELSQTARLVALETGTPLVLSGTVGPSGVIDADGRWVSSVPAGTLTVTTVSVPPAHETLYDKTGDLPWIAVIAAVGLACLWVRDGRGRTPQTAETNVCLHRREECSCSHPRSRLPLRLHPIPRPAAWAKSSITAAS